MMVLAKSELASKHVLYKINCMGNQTLKDHPVFEQVSD